jgi:hypothetical protein
MYNFGNSGANGKPFKEYNPTDKFLIEKGKVYWRFMLLNFGHPFHPFG